MPPNPYWQEMKSVPSKMLFDQYQKEGWKHAAGQTLRSLHTKQRKTAVLDLWMLYFLAQSRTLPVLGYFDVIYVTHETISEALKELLQSEDIALQVILRFLLELLQQKKLVIESPTLEQQLELREEKAYGTEVDSALLLADIKDCVAFVGEFRCPIPERYYERVIRPDQFSGAVRFLYSPA